MAAQESDQIPVPSPSGGAIPVRASDVRPGEEPSGSLPTSRTFLRKIFVPGYYSAGLVITSALVPTIMIAVTLVVFIGGWPDGRALCIGIVAGLLGWGIMALVAQHFSTVDRANPEVYQELRSRVDILRTRMSTIQGMSHDPTQPRGEDPNLDIRLAAAKAEMDTYLRQVQNALGH
jgi:hypothetical protein